MTVRMEASEVRSRRRRSKDGCAGGGRGAYGRGAGWAAPELPGIDIGGKREAPPADAGTGRARGFFSAAI